MPALHLLTRQHEPTNSFSLSQWTLQKRWPGWDDAPGFEVRVALVLAEHGMLKACSASLGHSNQGSPVSELTTWAQKKLLQQQDWMSWACWWCLEKLIPRQMTHSVHVEINSMTARQDWETSALWEWLAVSCAQTALLWMYCTVHRAQVKTLSNIFSTKYWLKIFWSTIQTLFAASTPPFMIAEETDFGCYTAVFTPPSLELVEPGMWD